MEQINSYDRIVKLKVRYATTLFLFCLLFVIAIFLLNTTIKSNERTNKALQTSFDNSSNHLGKYRSFKLKNPNLYCNLILSSIVNGNSFKLDSAGLGTWDFYNTEIWYNTFDGQIYSWNNHFSNLENEFDSIRNQSEKFGFECEKAFTQETDSAKRLALLNNIADSIFINPKVKIYLNKFILKELNGIFTTENWHQIVQWIVFDEWPPTGGVSGSTGPGISYTNRFSECQDYDNKKSHLYQTLLITDKNIVESLLINDWENAYIEKEKYNLQAPKFNIASIGFNIGIDNILLVVGPLLFFFQALFLLYWMREQQLLLTNNGIQQEFLFPDFNIKGSPFQIENFSKSISDFFSHLFWTMFLILPILILFFGFLTRYDVVSVKTYSFNHESLLKQILWYRSNDLISILIDIVTLVCLTLSIIIVLFITKKDQSKTEIKHPLKNKTSISFLFGIIFIISLFLLFKLKLEYSETILLIIIQWFILIYLSIVSIFNKSPFVLCICIIAILVNLFLILS